MPLFSIFRITGGRKGPSDPLMVVQSDVPGKNMVITHAGEVIPLDMPLDDYILTKEGFWLDDEGMAIDAEGPRVIRDDGLHYDEEGNPVPRGGRKRKSRRSRKKAKRTRRKKRK